MPSGLPERVDLMCLYDNEYPSRSSRPRFSFTSFPLKHLELDHLESFIKSKDASGEDEDATDPYIYDIGSIRHALFAAGADPSTSDANRRKLYALYQSYNEVLGDGEDEDNEMGEDEKDDGEEQSEDGEEAPEKDGWEDVGEASDAEEELVGKKKGKENGHVNRNGKQHERQNGIGSKGAGKGTGAVQVARTKPPKTKDAKVVHDPARLTIDNMIETGMDWEGEDGEVEEKPTAKEEEGNKQKSSNDGARKNGGEISLAEAHAAGKSGGQQENKKKRVRRGGRKWGKKGKGTVAGSAMTGFAVLASPIVANTKVRWLHLGGLPLP